MAKVIPFQVELLHPPDADTKLLSVQAIKYGPTIMITATVINGATLDEALQELRGFLASKIDISS